MKKNNLYIIYVFLFISGCTTPNNTSSKFDKLIHILDTEYIKKVDTSKITNSAIENALENLDPHSVYLKPENLEKLLVSTKGEYGGVGISMHIKNSVLTITKVFENTPANKLGLRANDVILKIDSHSTLGLSIENCVSLTKGKQGTYLSFTIIRKSEKRPLLFRLKREKVMINPIKSQLLSTNILYIDIPTFNKKTVEQLENILKYTKNYKGLILDLRSNPGGILGQAVSVVDMFINKGLIVKQKGRDDKYNMDYMASSHTIDSKTPMMILIDSGSASASEIVAGALQVLKRATLIGEKSFGKGSVQTLFALDNNSAIKLTIAKYYLPNGSCIDKIGIKPDIYVKSNHTLENNVVLASKKRLKLILKSIQNGTLKPKHIQPDTNTKSISNYKIRIDKQLRRALQELRNSN